MLLAPIFASSTLPSTANASSDYKYTAKQVKQFKKTAVPKKYRGTYYIWNQGARTYEKIAMTKRGLKYSASNKKWNQKTAMKLSGKKFGVIVKKKKITISTFKQKGNKFKLNESVVVKKNKKGINVNAVTTNFLTWYPVNFYAKKPAKKVHYTDAERTFLLADASGADSSLATTTLGNSSMYSLAFNDNLKNLTISKDYTEVQKFFISNLKTDASYYNFDIKYMDSNGDVISGTAQMRYAEWTYEDAWFAVIEFTQANLTNQTTGKPASSALLNKLMNRSFNS